MAKQKFIIKKKVVCTQSVEIEADNFNAAQATVDCGFVKFPPLTGKDVIKTAHTVTYAGEVNDNT